MSLKVTVVVPASTAITEAKFKKLASLLFPLVNPPVLKDLPSPASPLLTNPLDWDTILYRMLT